MKDESFRPNRVLSYFQEEWKILFFVTVSGLIYNLGLLAGPWFEGKMTGKLVDLLGGTGTFHQMLMLVTAYVVSIGIVQVSRYFKRFYVRRFANNVNRHMKQILYGTLVRKSRLELEAEGTGNVLTKAILDVDDCVEGMRKFTTEIFDTGVALLSYACMLLWYDWKLALLCMIFPPISYVIAEKMKVMVQKTGAAYKVQSGALSAATLDRATNAITYLFKLLLGSYEPQKGMVLIWGVPSVDLSDAKKRKVFGYVEQSFHMVPGSVKDQITLYDSKISNADVKKAAELTGLAKTIEALPYQYDTICTQDLFSQGQWQLLSIARAAAAEPEILLLDEITANLDAETEKMVLNALQRVSKNRTVISISHRTMAETGRVIPIS